MFHCIFFLTGNDRLDECISGAIEIINERKRKNENRQRSDSGYEGGNDAIEYDFRVRQENGGPSKFLKPGHGSKEPKYKSLHKTEILAELTKYIINNLPKCKQDLLLVHEVRVLLGGILYKEFERKTIVNLAWDSAVFEWNQKLMIEIIEIQDKLFQDKPSHFTRYRRYYSPRFSYIMALYLLKKQLITDDNVRHFIKNVCDWFDKITPKVNTICVYGKPNCGKSYFWDSITALAWNTGLMKNMNKHCAQFGMDDCYNRRCIEYNEANIHKDFIDKLKEIFEGKPSIADKKYVDAVCIERTPVFICSNHDICRTCPEERGALDARMHIYNWEEQRWLKNYNGALHPVLWKYLIEFINEPFDLDTLPELMYYSETDKHVIFETEIINFY